MPGVVDTKSGYSNGVTEDPTYKAVCTGQTGHRETVRVTYDPARVSLEALLFAYFAVIHPDQKNAQGNDVGTQYQAGIYYADEESGKTVCRVVEIERERHKKFYVEIEPIRCFFRAEDYHQHYLDKNPGGYCHIPREEIDHLSHMAFDPAAYTRPAKEQLSEKLSAMQYRVTQDGATEPPFQNDFWAHFERGIYVDIVTGEPLFSSRQKYQSSCGWPSFSGGIDRGAIIELEDRSHFMTRTEVRSRAGNSHLGHVFSGDRESPTGTRYCINSAALRFIPFDEMDAQGYGALKKYVE